jgi:hypothetical protein
MLWSSKTQFESATHLLARNVISRRNECMIIDCNSVTDIPLFSNLWQLWKGFLLISSIPLTF